MEYIKYEIRANVPGAKELQERLNAPSEQIPKRWFRCPHCGKSLFPLREETKIQNMAFRCKACKHDIEVNI